jgi:hypothetical protein
VKSAESRIEIRVAELKQLFNPIDPSPLSARDLDAKFEDFIVGWAKEYPRDASLILCVDVESGAANPREETEATDGIHRSFRSRSESARRSLRQLFRLGRTSLAIGLAALAVLVGLGNLLSRWLENSSLGGILRETMSIGGWVAMWRPMEVFLYDWWPIRREERLFDRLAMMPVRIRHLDSAPSVTKPAQGVV